MDAIDIHFHAVPPGFVDAVRSGVLADVVEIDSRDGLDRLVFHAPAEVVLEPGTVLRPRLHDSTILLGTLDRYGLDAAAPSLPPELFLYWASPEAGLAIARAANDGFAEWAGAFPDRFLPLATVPLQAPELAAQELWRAVMELGLRGVAVCSHVNGQDLDGEEFEPFLAAAAELAVPVFIHPQNAGDMRRLHDMHLWNLVGFPGETALTAARLILSGVFERHPDLTVILSHGGGYFPYQIGRLDHGWTARAALRERLPRPPSAYLGNIVCDSLVHDGEALRFLATRLGDENVVLGSDHPFDMGSETPAADVRAAIAAPESQRLILGENLRRLLKV